MLYLLDTTAFSDLIREHPAVSRRLANVLPAVLVTRDSDLRQIDGLTVED
jgi:predicted nucleic acid-binding protein